MLDFSHVEVVLSGMKATEGVELSFDKIEKEGLLYIIQQHYMLPYIYLRAANQDNCALAANLLPMPGLPFSWENFESLEHHLQV